MLKKILNVTFWVVFSVVLAIWVIDYIQVRNSKDPKFCLKKTTHQYEDGTVKECLGLGYRIYEYDRDSLAKGTDFAPFFIKEKVK